MEHTEHANAPLEHDPSMAPGGQSALAQGCHCSVLANAAFRAGGANESPFIDPRCPLHALAT